MPFNSNGGIDYTGLDREFPNKKDDFPSKV